MISQIILGHDVPDAIPQSISKVYIGGVTPYDITDIIVNFGKLEIHIEFLWILDQTFRRDAPAAKVKEIPGFLGFLLEF